MSPAVRPRPTATLAMALVLTAGGAAMLSPTAAAATSQSLSYVCRSADLGTFQVTAEHSFAETAAYGGRLQVTTAVTLPADTADELRSTGITAVQGLAQNRVLLSGTTVGTDQRIRWTPVPATGSMELEADGTADGVDAEVGETLPIALADDYSSELELQLDTYTSDPSDPRRTLVSCDLAPGQDLTAGTATVVKARLRFDAYMSYDDQHRRVTTKVLWSRLDSSAVPTGGVLWSLKRNGKRIGGGAVPSLDDLRNRTFATAAPKRGSFVFKVRYPGDSHFERSGVTSYHDSFD